MTINFDKKHVNYLENTHAHTPLRHQMQTKHFSVRAPRCPMLQHDSGHVGLVPGNNESNNTCTE